MTVPTKCMVEHRPLIILKRPDLNFETYIVPDLDTEVNVIRPITYNDEIKTSGLCQVSGRYGYQKFNDADYLEEDSRLLSLSSEDNITIQYNGRYYTYNQAHRNWKDMADCLESCLRHARDIAAVEKL